MSRSPTARRFGQYVLLEVVGVGATAQVWSAYRHPHKSELVALKIWKWPLVGVEHSTAARELRAVAAAQHSAIVTVEDIIEDGDRIGLVMELCRGSLADWLRVHGPLPAYWIAKIGADTLSGLDAAHRAGVLHRDIKPGNLLVAEDGSIKIADFGIAKLLESDTTGGYTSSVAGTIPFVAPERRYGRTVDARADLYGVAVTLACLAVGDVVGELFIPAVRERLEARVPESLCDVLARAAAYAPDDRYPDAETMRKALLEILDTLPGRDAVSLTDLSRLAAMDTHAPTERHPPSSPGLPTWSLALGAGLLVGGFALGSAWQAGPPHPLEDLPRCDGAADRERTVLRLGPKETNAGLAHDLDADGHVDLVFVNQLDESLSIYWGGSADPFGELLEIPVGRSGVRPAVGDVDEDGHLDLVLSITDDSELLLLRGRPGRHFGSGEPSFQAPAPGRLALVDWDEDGYLDLLFQTVGRDDCTAFRRGNGDGTFEIHACIGRQSDLLDPYGAGPPAIYRRSEDGDLVRHLRAPDGSMAPSEPIVDLAAIGAASAHQFVARDLDDDGSDEIYGLATGRKKVALIRIDPGGDACELRPKISFNAAGMADVADVDENGLLDVVAHVTCKGCESNHQVFLAVPD